MRLPPLWCPSFRNYPTDHFKLQQALRSYAKDLPQLLSRNQRFSLCLNSPLNPPPLGRSPSSHSPGHFRHLKVHSTHKTFISIVAVPLWPLPAIRYLIHFIGGHVATNCFGEGQTCLGINSYSLWSGRNNENGVQQRRSYKGLEEGVISDEDEETLYYKDESQAVEMETFYQSGEAKKAGRYGLTP